MSMTKELKITAYLKPYCGWSQGVRAVFKKYSLSYQERDIITNPEYYDEMIRKTGQRLSPCVEINGEMLTDVSGDEVEVYLVKKNYVQRESAKADVPTDRGCSDESEPIRFEGHFNPE